ncbi:hypothetical protein [Planctomycetes bacterium Pan216]|uniref:hypothetical protein n=1 Tax=Kolteria novifilia TaxID=2527975 RepID=UPI0011A62D0A
MNATRWLLVGIVCFAGCSAENGPARSRVVGRVNVDGHPLPSGMIRLTPIEGTRGPTAGASIAEGMFVVRQDRGPVRGKHRVEIRAYRQTGRKVAEPGLGEGVLVDETEQYLPAHYNDESTLVLDVRERSQTFDVDLTLEPSAP